MYFPLYSTAPGFVNHKIAFLLHLLGENRIIGEKPQEDRYVYTPCCCYS